MFVEQPLALPGSAKKWKTVQDYFLGTVKDSLHDDFWFCRPNYAFFSILNQKIKLPKNQKNFKQLITKKKYLDLIFLIFDN